MVDYELSRAIRDVMDAFSDQLGLVPELSGLTREQRDALESLDRIHKLFLEP